MSKLTRGFKAGWRARSLGFGLAVAGRTPSEVRVLNWHGRQIHYRTRTDDVVNIEKILLKQPKRLEYWLPDEIQPKTILDCGANIGITSLYFNRCWPAATILALEPWNENYELLLKNTQGLPNVRCFNLAAGETDGSASLLSSEASRTGSLGLLTAYAGSDAKAVATVPVVRLDHFFADNRIEQVNLIKIDTEGSEYPILKALPESQLRRVKWIVGEMHGVEDWKLLDLLAQAGFALDVKKPLHKRHYKFHACNPSLLPEIVAKHRHEFRFLQS